MSVGLGGPGVACSAMRVRRLDAGELAGRRAGADRGAPRRLRALPGRRAGARRASGRGSRRELPFERFAAGVAERLAAPRRRRRGPAALRAVGLALAAGLAARRGGARRAARRHARSRRPPAEGRRGADRVRAARARPRGRSRRASRSRRARRCGSASRRRAARFAAVALVDADGAVDPPRRRGASRASLPGAFEWTGAGEGTLVAVLADAPVDAAALADRLARGGPEAASPGGGAEVLVRPLAQGRPVRRGPSQPSRSRSPWRRRPAAAAAERRFALVAGEPDGGGGTVRLRYAERDARRIHAILTRGGRRPPRGRAAPPLRRRRPPSGAPSPSSRRAAAAARGRGERTLLARLLLRPREGRRAAARRRPAPARRAARRARGAPRPTCASGSSTPAAPARSPARRGSARRPPST